MQIQKVGQRGRIFVFEEGDSPMSMPTLVYLIQGNRHWFLCDTHLGPVSMEVVQEYIRESGEGKPLIVFNSHSDYDHIWGNCAFPEATIIAHRLCKEEMEEKGEGALRNFADFQNGEVQILLPNRVFEERLDFEEDGVEFFYSPGHTINSASCYDREDGILFVGDLIERPIPYVGSYRLDLYLQTLEQIRQMPAHIMLSAHSGFADTALIEENIAYIRALQKGEEPSLPDEEAVYVHAFNQKNVLSNRYESMARDTLGERFHFDEFIAVVLKYRDGSVEELEQGLADYIKSCQT